MYAATSTRPDIAYAVHQLCKCLHKPTPGLLSEADHVLSYLSRTSDLGLTYTREHMRLQGYADASWETAHSTSGWVVFWQCAALTWGSRKQKSIALSSCEAEIIALSEAAKDVVQLMELEGRSLAGPQKTKLQERLRSCRTEVASLKERLKVVKKMELSPNLGVPFAAKQDAVVSKPGRYEWIAPKDGFQSAGAAVRTLGQYQEAATAAEASAGSSASASRVARRRARPVTCPPGGARRRP